MCHSKETWLCFRGTSHQPKMPSGMPKHVDDDTGVRLHRHPHSYSREYIHEYLQREATIYVYASSVRQHALAMAESAESDPLTQTSHEDLWTFNGAFSRGSTNHKNALQFISHYHQASPHHQRSAFITGTGSFGDDRLTQRACQLG